MKLRNCLVAGVLLAGILSYSGCATNTKTADGSVRRLEFNGVKSENRFSLKELNPEMPSDWSPYNYLVMEMRTSTPQRFSIWANTANGKRRIMFQPFGQNVWLRASVPLRYFEGRDQSGFDLASTINRRTDSFWMSVWGPFGDLTSVKSLSFIMDYPINKPTVEIRSVHLSKDGRRLGVSGNNQRAG